MKLHLPIVLLTSVMTCMVIADEPTPVTESFGAGTYTYVTSPDDTITSTFIGDCTDGSFGTSQQGYESKGWVGGIPVSETDRFATNTAIIIGDGTTETKIGAVVGIGRRGYASTGNKSITVNANAYAGTIYASYNLKKGHNSGLAVTGAESYYKNKKYFAPKADVGSEINVKLDGGSALQIYGGLAQVTTDIPTEMREAAAALGSKEAAEAYAAGNPAWALNEKIIISIINGKVGVTSDGNVHSSIANDPTIAVIIGGGMAGSAVNNEVAISVSGDSEVNGSISAGASAYDTTGGTARGFVNSTSVTVSGGTITGNVLGGGGKGGIVKNGTSITLSGGTVAGNVYGAGNGDEVLEGGTTITLSNDAKVGETIHGGGYNGAVVTGDKILNLGTEEEAYKGTIKAADFTDINMNNGDVTISYTPSEEGTNLTVGKNSSLTINGDFTAGELKMNGGTLRIIGGTLTADSVTLSDFSYEVYNPGYVGGGDNLNGFKQDSGRIAVGLDIGGTLTSVKDSDGVEYFYNSDLDRYVAPGTTHWDTYYINTSDHEAKASEIIEARKEAQGDDAPLPEIKMSAGTLGVNQSVRLTAAPAVNENGEIVARPVINVSGDDTVLSGSTIDCATMHASGGQISAHLHGDTSLTVTGDVEITGENSQTGDTIITGPDATLTIGTDTALGASTVKLQNQATLDLNGKAANNMIEVTGCTVANAGAYVGRMEVASHLTFVGPASARCISLRDKGEIIVDSLHTTTLEALSDKGAARYSGHTITGDVTIKNEGAIILHSGKQITLSGSLTLSNGVAMVLLDAGGEFAVGDILVTCISGTITGDFSELDFLINNEEQEGYRVEISEDRKSVVLAEDDKPIVDPGEDEEDKPIVGPDVPVQPDTAPVFEQATADVLAQGNWGVVSASRAFVGAVQGQRNDMGCIANGRGTAWASLLGGMTDISGSGAAAGSDITLFGAAVGVDMKVGKRSSLGVAFGYTDGEVSADGLGDIDQEGGHIALYGEHGLKKFANNSCLSLDWVVATGTTESKYMGAKWEQDSIQLNTRLTRSKQVTDRLSYNVFGGLEYFASESDRTANCKSGSVQNLRGELGIGIRYVVGKGAQPATGGNCTPAPACERVVLYGEVSYINDMVRNNPSIEVNGLRGRGANPGRHGVGVEAGATIRLGEKWSAGANYSFNAMDDSNEHILNIGASRTF